MVTRLAVTGVGHWHALQDAAYLTHLPAIPDVALVALHDPEPGRAAAVAAALPPASPAVSAPPAYFADLEALLADARPDFVLALGRPDTMAATGGELRSVTRTAQETAPVSAAEPPARTAYVLAAGRKGR